MQTGPALFLWLYRDYVGINVYSKTSRLLSSLQRASGLIEKLRLIEDPLVGIHLVDQKAQWLQKQSCGVKPHAAVLDLGSYQLGRPTVAVDPNIP